MKRFLLTSLFIIAIFITAIAQATNDYQSNGTGGGDWDDLNSWERWDGDSWETPTGGEGVPDSGDGDVTILEDDIISIPSGYTATIDDLYIDLFGELVVDSGGTLDLVDGADDDLQIFNDGLDNGFLTVDGRFILNQGATAVEDDAGPPGDSFFDELTDLTTTVSSTGVFQLNGNGTVIGADWQTGSTVEVTGAPTAAPMNLNQSFENFTWNCTSQTANIDLATALTTINGDLTVSSTGGGTRSLRLTNSVGSVTFNIGGDLIVENDARFVAWGTATGITLNVSGNIDYTTTGTCQFGSSGTGTVNVTGNMSVTNSSGTLRAATSSGNTTFDLDGNFTFTSGTIDSDNGGADPGATFRFSGSGAQTFTGGGSFTDIINFEVANGSILDMGTGVFAGSGDFDLEAGGTLRVGSSDGLTQGTSLGNIRVGGTRTYAAGGNVVYDGLVAQSLGDEWDTGGALNSAAVNLEIDNASGVTNNLVATASVVGILTLTDGPLNIGNTNTLDVQGVFNGNGGTIGGSTTSNLTFSGAGAFTGSLDLESPFTLNNLTISRGGSITLDLGTDLVVEGTLSFGSNSNLDISGQTLTTSSAATSDITQSSTGGLISSNLNRGSLILNGTGAISAIPFQGSSNELVDLTFNRSIGTYAWTSSVTVTGTLSLTDGTVTNSSGALEMGSGSTFIRTSTELPTPTGIFDGSIIAAAGDYNIVYMGISYSTGLELVASSINDLTIDATTVTLSEPITVEGDYVNDGGTFDAGSNSVTFNGDNFTISAGSFTTTGSVTFSKTSGTTTMSGTNIQFANVTIGGTTTLSAPNGNVGVSGSWTNSGTFTPNSGTVTFNDNVGPDQSINPAGQPFNNVVFDQSANKVLSGTLDANNLTIMSGTLDVGAGSEDVFVSGTWSNSGTFDANNGTVTFDGTNQTIDNGSQSFNNLTLSTGGTKSLSVSDLDVDGNFTIDNSVTFSPLTRTVNLEGNLVTNGTLTAGNSVFIFDGSSTQTISAGSAFHDVTISSTGTVQFPASNINVSGTWNRTSGTFDANGGTVTLNGSSESITSGGQSFNDVIIAGAGTKTLMDAFDIDGNLTLNASTLDVSGSNYTVTLDGNWDASGGGSFNPQSGQVIFNGITQNITSSGESFNNVQIASTSTATISDAADINGNIDLDGTMNLSSSIDLEGNLDLDGTLTGGSQSINIAGNWDATDGSFTTSGLTTFDGTTQSITSDGSSFGAVTIASTSSLLDIFDANGDLTITSSLSAGANGMTVGGDWDSGSGTFTSTGLVTLDGGAQNITIGAANAFNNLTIAGTSATMQDELDIDGNLIISSTLSAGSDNDILIAGNWTNNGTFTAAAGKVTFDGNGTFDVDGTPVSSVFYDIDVADNSTTVEIETAHSLAGTLTLVGTTSSFNADGSGGSGDFTLISTDDSPATDGSIAELMTPANFTGNVTVERYITTGDVWKYIASPVSGLTVADWQTEFPVSGLQFPENDNGNPGVQSGALPSLYRYNAGSEVWEAYPTAAASESIDPGRGYSSYIRDNTAPFTDNVVSQEGPINKGNWDFTQSGQGNLTASTSGWNLLGNPYPAPLDWNNLHDNGSTNIDGTVSIRDNSSGIFRGWNAVSNMSLNSGTQYIAAGQSFWVNTTTSPSLTATESMKVTDQTHTFYNIETPINYLRIALQQGADSDETVIIFYDDATSGKDIYDSYKRTNDIFNLSSLMDDGSDLVINSPSSLDCDSEIALNITQADPGNFQLSFTEFESFVEDFDIMLKDNFTNTVTSIKDNPIYSFEITGDANSTGNGRFTVFFGSSQIDQTLAITTEGDSCIGNTVLVSVNDSQLGLHYQAYIDGNPVSDPIAGDGSIISLEAVTDGLTEGDYMIEVMAIKPGCSSLPLSQEASISLSEIPATAIVTDGGGCTGQSVTLSASGAPVDGYYNWYLTLESSEPIEEANEASFITPVLEVSRSYFVTAVNNNGCESLVREEVIATVGTVDLVDEVSSEIACPGQSVTLTATGAPEDGFYRWYDSSESLIDGESGSLFTTSGLLESTDYYVSVVNSTSCESEKVSITAIISNEVLIVEAENALICGGGTITLIASGAPEGDSYQWYDDSGSLLDGETGSELARDVSETTSYSVQIISSTGCNSELLDVLAEVRDAPDKPVIIIEEEYLKSSITGPEYTYQWYNDSIAIPGEDGSKFLHENIAGDYQVEITKDGCPNISETDGQNLVLSVEGELNLGELDLYPNPASDFIRLEFEGVESAKVSIYVIEMSGRIIQSEVLNNHAGRIDWQLDTKEYENGVYFVKLADGNRVLTGRFVKK